MVSGRVLDPRPLLGGVELDGVSVAANMHGPLISLVTSAPNTTTPQSG